MKLNFEYVGIIGQGNYPDFLQYPDTEGQLFFLDAGEMYGVATTRLDGEFSEPTWLDTLKVSPDSDMSLLKMNTLNGWGLIGSYKTPTAQKIILYEFLLDMDRYLSLGSIKYSIDNPIASFSLTLENPKNENSDIGSENAVMGEKTSLFSPGARIEFRFTMGDGDWYDMGTFYVDRTKYSLLSETASVDGRNLTGKTLRDQALNEKYNLGYKKVTATFGELLNYANLTPDQYKIEESVLSRSFTFEPTMDVLAAIEEILKTLVNWKMEETPEGKIVIGTQSYSEFTPRNTYVFLRNKDIFGRDIQMDDAESYRKVCVHDKDWAVSVYRDVVNYSGWNLQNNKTLFVEVPDGTTLTNAEEIADELANRLQRVGRIESFSGPFRPQLVPGDGAEIIDDDGTTTLGLITEITHEFGKNGFHTKFTVDSGGRLGKGRLSDYIAMVRGEKTPGSIGYEDIIPEPEPES